MDIKKVLDKRTEINGRIRNKTKELYGRADIHVKHVGSEYRKNLITALSAALAFVIALYIRDSVTVWVEFILKSLNLTGKEGLMYKTILGLVVVGICVLGIIVLSKFGEKEQVKK